MKQIEPVQIWVNGSVQTGTWINAIIREDNLKDFAIFYWAIFADGDEPDTQGLQLSAGNLTINEPDYSVWDSTADINQSAYEWICNELNLTLIP
jgi:hypothetical protein